MRIPPTIFIIGEPGSCKSALAIAIEDVLKKHGVQAVIKDDEEINIMSRVRQDWPQRMLKLNGRRVEIRTLQAHRPSLTREALAAANEDTPF